MSASGNVRQPPAAARGRGSLTIILGVQGRQPQQSSCINAGTRLWPMALSDDGVTLLAGGERWRTLARFRLTD